MSDADKAGAIRAGVYFATSARYSPEDAEKLLYFIRRVGGPRWIIFFIPPDQAP